MRYKMLYKIIGGVEAEIIDSDDSIKQPDYEMENESSVSGSDVDDDFEIVDKKEKTEKVKKILTTIIQKRLRVHRQSIHLTIIEEDSYEKDVLFYVQLGEPQMSGDDEIASLAAEAEKKRAEDRTEIEKLAILGKPRCGDITRAQIRIKESKEFKVL
ncbi:hypothetical protein RN001_000278 [Aquatica leii]|uniref:Uncharacterized protein n=1 Tax=Aquatica leii TaxID=1421715 RepID=A0AAN7PEN0_9COLE|nr:hypothetical protein RN001_000278 [Aquatica leii]